MKNKLLKLLSILACGLLAVGLTACGDNGDSSSSHSHNYSVSEYKAPTCTESGYTLYTCSCGDVYNERENALGHNFENYVSDNNAVCENYGTKTAVCENVGCTKTDTITDADSWLDHSFTNYVSNNDATCANFGTKTAVCDNGCGKTNTTNDYETKKPDHTYSDVWSTDSYYHWHDTTCGCPAKSNYENHADNGTGSCLCSYSFITYTIENNEACITNYRGNAADLTIPSSYEGYPVTSISRQAFNGCSYLKNVIVPDSVTSISYNAFYQCNSLESITIPFIGPSKDYDSGYEYLGYIFNFTNSSSFFIPDSLTTVTVTGGTIEAYALTECTNLETLIIGTNVTYVSPNCDSSFANIEVVENNPLYTSVDGILYSKDKTTLLLYPANKNPSSFTIPHFVTSIGKSAFSGCSNLTDIDIPNSVTTIESSAFSGCSNLTSIDIPNSVTTIESSAFSGCSNLEKIIVSPDNLYYTSQNGILYDMIEANILIVPQSIKGAITIPIGVTAIEADTFYERNLLTSVSIPETVTSIGRCAFYGCTSLEQIILPFVGASKDATDEEAVFGYIFGYTSYILNTDMPNDVIHQYTAPSNYATHLYGYHIPASIKTVTIKGGTLHSNAFLNCKMLTTVTIGENVTAIEKNPFQKCDNLVSITVDEKNSICTSKDGVLYNKEITEFITVPMKLAGEFTIPNTITAIKGAGSSLDDKGITFAAHTELTSVTIPSSVTSIGAYAFGSCTKLTEIIFDGTVAQWNAIEKITGLSAWNLNVPATKVVCTNGEVAI